MLTFYRRQVHHDRRRILFATLLTLAAGGFGRGLLPDPLLVPTELLVVTGFLAMIPVFTAKYRAKRHWVELTALGNLIVTAAGDLAPAGFFGWHGVMYMLTLQIPAYLGIVVGLRMFVYGRWSDAFAPRNRYVVEARLTTCLRTQDLWFGMVPTPGYVDRNPDREVVSIEFADAGKRAVRLTTWVPPRIGAGEVLLEFDEIVPFKYARFNLRVLKGTRDPSAEGDTELFFEDRGDHRVLRMRHKVNGFTPRRALLGYFDDTFSRLMTARLIAIETQVASGRPTKSDTSFNCWFENHGDVRDTVAPELGTYRTAYGRERSKDEMRTLEALGRL